MTSAAHLSWVLLSIGVALWALPRDDGRIDRPLSYGALAGSGLAGLCCALLAGASAG
jgi:hypothetical protein